MQVRTTWAIVGGLWGGGVGLLFGPIPAGSLAYIVLEELWQPPYEELLFAALWGSFVLLAGAIGFTTGSLLGGVRRGEASDFGQGVLSKLRRTSEPVPDSGPPLPRERGQG